MTRILLEPTGYHFLNVGDVAMRQVAVRRLREFWPDAAIHVLADDEAELAAHCPDTEFVPAEGQRAWLYGLAARRAPRRLPARSRRALAHAEERARVRGSRPLLAATGVARRMRGRDTRAIRAFLDAIEGADALVVSGGGFVTDSFAPYALVVLRELELAMHRGIPTFMFGQGIGPIANAELWAAARRVLPEVSTIAVREGKTSPELLARLGVPADRVLVTGDDALALAADALPSGEDLLGVNVRVAGYSPLTEAAAARIRAGIGESAAATGAGLIAVPISRHPGEPDLANARTLFPALDGAEARTAEDAIGASGRCRVVVSGSYHAGVFALAQGVPCVGLVTSPFYRGKFDGLAAQFPGGCWVVDVEEPAAGEQLAAAIRDAWNLPAPEREGLRALARAQVAASRAAYARVRELVGAARR